MAILRLARFVVNPLAENFFRARVGSTNEPENHQVATTKSPKSNLHKAVLSARKARDRDIMRRAGRKESHETIAQALGMTRQRVGQIIKANTPKGE